MVFHSMVWQQINVSNFEAEEFLNAILLNFQKSKIYGSNN